MDDDGSSVFEAPGADSTSEGGAARGRDAGGGARRVAPWAASVALLVAAAGLGLAALTAGPPIAAPAAVQAAPVLRPVAVIGAAGSLGEPTGVAVSGDRVYVADPALHAVAVFTTAGKRVATIGAGTLKTPVYVAVGSVDGRVYVVDREAGAVLVYASDGGLLGRLGPSGTAPRPGDSRAAWKPLSLGFGSDGTLYVADVAGIQSIVEFSPLGARIATLGATVPRGQTGDRIAFPNGIAVTPARVVVADSNNGRLLFFDRLGALDDAVQLDGLPRGVAALPDGTFAVSDAASHQLRVFTSGGQEVAQVGGFGTDPDSFAYPAGVAVDEAGRIYVADTGNRRVDVWQTALPAAPRVPAQPGQAPFAAAAGVCAVFGLLILAISGVRRRLSSRA